MSHVELATPMTASLRHLKIGDAVTVHALSRHPSPTRVSKIGRKFIYVDHPSFSQFAFDLDTGRERDWTQYEVRTTARHAWLERVRAARIALLEFGVTVSMHVGDEVLVEIRRALVHIIPHTTIEKG